MLNTLWQKIYDFFNSFPDVNQSVKSAFREMQFSDRAVFALFIISYVFAATIIAVNALLIQYADLVTGLLFPPASTSGFLFLYVTFLNMRKKHYHTSQFFLSVLYTILFIYTMFLTCGAAMLTPSTRLLNYQLLDWDLALGFNQLPIIVWTTQHHWVDNVLTFGYGSWTIQIGILAPLLALCRQYTEVKRWTFAGILAITLVSIFYYFYPSLPPATVFTHYHFKSACYDCIDRFYLLHAYQPFYFTNCGLIVFPSCHVIWALLNTYAFRKVPWVFWPLLILNVILIASTIMLGMHFLVDVLGAVVVFFIVLGAAHWVIKRDQPRASNPV